MSFGQLVLYLLAGRISTKIVAPYLLLVFFLAVLATFVVMRLISGSLEERITNQLLDAGRSANDAVVKIERDHLAQFRLMAFTEGVDSALAAGDIQTLRRVLEPLQVNGKLDIVDAVDTLGTHLLALRQDETGVRQVPEGRSGIQSMEIVRKMLAGEVDALGDKFSDLIEAPDGFVLYSGGPVKTSDGRTVGLILVGTRLSEAVERIGREGLASVVVYRPDGTIINSTLPSPDPSVPAGAPLDPDSYNRLMTDPNFVLLRSLDIGGRQYSELLGRMEVRKRNVTVLGVALPKTAIAQAGSATRNQMVLMFAGVIFVCLVIGLTLARHITRPILQLVAACRRVMRGDYDVQVQSASSDETGVLARSFNEMVAGLRDRDRIKDTFGRYVTKEVANAILSGDVKLGGERKEVTVLISDIRGFTSLSETLEPEELVTMLNKYFSSMIDAIMRYGGVLDKFIGDAILAVYNAPIPYPDHALRAVKTCLEMRERLAAFNEDRIRQGLQPIRIGIGLNTGYVVAGNIGSEQRTEYTVIGDTVNATQRVEDLTKEFKTDILISDSTYERVKDQVEVGSYHEVQLRGRRQLTKIYPVLGLTGQAPTTAIAAARASAAVVTPQPVLAAVAAPVVAPAVEPTPEPPPEPVVTPAPRPSRARARRTAMRGEA